MLLNLEGGLKILVNNQRIFNVDIVYKSGKSKWNQSAKHFNWGLILEDPVLKYRKTQKYLVK